MNRWYGIAGAAVFAVATVGGALAASTAPAAPTPGKTAAAISASHAVARPAMSRKRVEAIQAALNNNGEQVTVDGYWGAKTSAALKDFQQKHGLKATGHIDHSTLGQLKVTTRT